MKILVETPYGKIESIEMDDSVGEIQEALQKTFEIEDLQQFTIQKHREHPYKSCFSLSIILFLCPCFLRCL